MHSYINCIARGHWVCRITSFFQRFQNCHTKAMAVRLLLPEDLSYYSSRESSHCLLKECSQQQLQPYELDNLHRPIFRVKTDRWGSHTLIYSLFRKDFLLDICISWVIINQEMGDSWAKNEQKTFKFNFSKVIMWILHFFLTKEEVCLFPHC